ncbi:MAG: hypothetical protein Q4B22_11020 [Eubacteriales bacterium]|nr:hypothetical protein [Eubacteriales bacterium]
MKKAKVLAVLLAVSMAVTSLGAGASTVRADEPVGEEQEIVFDEVTEETEETEEAATEDETAGEENGEDAIVFEESDVEIPQTEDEEETELEVAAEEEDVTEVVESDSEETADEALLGDNFSSAKSIQFNKKYTGNISTSNRSDFYKITLPSSGRIEVSANASIYRVGYLFYDASGNRYYENTVYWNDTTKMSTNSFSYDLTKGTYYFVVEGRRDGYGSYNFKVKFTSAGETFTESGNGTNNSMGAAKAVSFGKTYKGQIAYNDSADFYRVTLPSSGRLKISATSYFYRIQYNIYNADGENIWGQTCYHNDSTGIGFLNNTIDLTKGTYYFVASKRFDDTGNYSFKLSFTGAGESFTESGWGTNNSMDSAQKIALNKQYKGQIAKNDERDYYKLTLNKAMNITFKATAYVDHIDYYIHKTSGERVYSSAPSWKSELGYSSVSENLTLQKGTYYLAVARNYGTGIYSFKFSSVTATKAMYRMYNPNSGEHFYTANAAERNHLKAIGWKYEGVSWKAPVKSNTPVYRLYNPNSGDHHYTTNKGEKDMLVRAKWKYEGIGWYSDDNKGVPIYRQYNPNAKVGSHNFTSSKSENNYLVRVGWKAEGIAWYGVK